MTTSTDSTSQKKKGPKKKGPIRFEAIIPATLFFGLVALYFILFFDSHLKVGLEKLTTLANGAEVNIRSIKTSFLKGYFQLQDLEVTNSDIPAENLVEIGQFYFEFSWDALLRAKLVVEEASIKNLQVGTQRKYPGKVIPPEPEVDSGPSMADQLAKKALTTVGDEFKGNILGDLAGLLQGADPTAKLKEFEGKLKAGTRAKELEVEFKKKEQEWQNRLKTLPHAKEFEALGNRLKQVKMGGWKTPQEFQQSLDEINSIFQEADQKIKIVRSSADQVNADVTTLDQSLRSLEELAKQDIKDLEAHIKLPALDAKDLAKDLFGKMVQEKVGGYQKYVDLGRKYMPPNIGEKKAPELKPHERHKGRTYKFGRTKSYPLLLIKKTQLTSRAENSPFGGNIDGKIVNITTEPTLWGQPTVATLQGDFPGKQIFKLFSQVTLDHTKEEAHDFFEVSVGSFPISGRTLVASPDVQLGFNSATGSTQVKGDWQGGRLSVKSSSEFQKIQYAVSSQIKDVEDILKGVVNDIPLVNLQAKVEGTLTDLKWDIQSNLAGALQKGFEKQVQAKIAEARKKLDEFVQNEINKHKAVLQAQLDQIRNQVQSQINQAKAEAEKARTQAEGQVQQAKDKLAQEEKKKVEKKVETEGQKVLDDLKKKFKF